MREHGDVHQRALAAAVRDVLARLTAGGDAPAEAPPVDAADVSADARPQLAEAPPVDAPDMSALETVCACFGLTAFERDVLVFAAAVEIEPGACAACAAASGDPHRPYPTFSLALATLRDPHWSALTPVGALRRWRLVELDPDGSAAGSVTTARLRIDERVLHFLTGVEYLDVRLRGLVRRIDSPPTLTASHQRVARVLAECWTAGRAPLAELSGADEQTREEVAAAAAEGIGLRPYAVRDADLPADPVEREALARLWEREALLLPAALVVEADASSTEHRSAVDGFAGMLRVPLMISTRDPLPVSIPPRERLTVPALRPDEQRDLWASALNGAGAHGAVDLHRLSAQFSLPAHVIRAAGGAVRRQLADLADSNGANAASTVDGAVELSTVDGEGDGPDDVVRLAWQAGLAEARVALDELGRRVEPHATRADLVLPAAQRVVLDEIVAHVRQRSTVYEQWGFESVLRRGLGITALFAGTSGTGKTLAAEVVAGQLGLDLFVIDLSQVVSKYIGETEKNLRRVFDAAERGGAVLLFDEADALFGKRSEVKDSHDRYANIEVSYLLMRMEEYRGLAILTTNMKKALDPAFLRRLRFVVEFPFPGVAERAEIWRRVIPGRTPVRDLDTDRLAQLTVAGGSIRNIALSAAFLAADEDVPLQMRHLHAAARTEYLKLERSLTPGEVSGWQ
jgi:hypothetical protein